MGEKELKLYNERIELFKNSVEHKPVSRVPIFSITDNWALFYYGTTLKEALKDPKLEYAAYEKALTDFPYDGSAFAGITTPMNFVASLGGGMYKDMDTLQVQTGQSMVMPVEDYDKLIEDPYKYILGTVLPKKYALFRLGSKMSMFFKLASSMSSMGNWAKNKAKAMDNFKNDHGLPVLNSVPAFVAADIMLDGLRDFKGMTTDIRRMPDKVAAAAMSITDNLCIPSISYAQATPSDEIYPQLYLHLPPWIGPKQFEKVYWPGFIKYLNEFKSRGYKMIVFFEKNYSHLYDYLEDLPKDLMIGLFEEDDLVTVKKRIGDVICVGGGIHVQDLMYKTPEECIDITKGIIDSVAPGGNFVFAPNKILLAANDARPENLKAVTEFVREYAMYK